MTLRLVLAQLNMRIGDYAGNTAKVITTLKAAKEKGADIIVFPELTLCGYPPEDLLHRKKFLLDGIRALKSIVPHVSDLTALIGFADWDKEGVYNSAAIIHNRKWIGSYRKILLPNYSVFDEKRYFNPGNEACIIQCEKIGIGLTICEDTWMSSGPVNTLLSSGISVLINMSASPYYIEKHKKREHKHSVLAKGGQLAVAYCNEVGGQDELVFDGGSFVLDEKGRVLARAARFTEENLVVDIIAEHKNNIDAGISEFPVKRFSIKLSKIAKPLVVPTISPLLGTVEEVFKALILGLKDYIVKNGFKETILGVSGGVDSALVAALASEALGAKNVMGISMPTVYSSDGTRSDAKILCERLGIPFREIAIQGIFEEFKKLLAPDFKDLPEGLAEENLQARLRANILMTYSNKFGCLLLTTGNKSEASVGYCTLYGDMAGGFAPIKDIPKDMVYKLTDYFNRIKGTDIIPQSIIDREPTAELKANQRDTDSLPPYPVLDKILFYHIEQHLDASDIARKGFPKAVVADILSKVRKSEYKRRQTPPGIKITPLAFGRDRRMPITNFYTGL